MTGNEFDGFRAQVVAWMDEHLRGEFQPLRDCVGFGDPAFDPKLAKRWEQELARGGWIGIGWPKEFGGRALPLSQQVVFHEEYVRAGGPGRLGHIGEQLLAPTLMAFGTPEQQRRFLPGILAGTEYWAQGYSEPNAGSDLANVQTRARLEGDSWVIDGQKTWTSWAHESDWAFVVARCEPGSQRHHGLVMLLVPLHQPGVTIRPIRQITGESEFNEVFFDGARTEASLHLGAPGEGWKVAMALLGFERGVSTLGQQAGFEREMQTLIEVARRNGAARDPVLRQRIAQAAATLDALRCNVLRVLAQDDAEKSGVPVSREAYIAKYVWSNWRRDFGRLAADVLGAAADVTDDDDEAARLLRQVWLFSRSDTIYAGANEIQLNLIAERALGMPR
jgi:acyl-CoA dehydrogenase